MTITIQTAFSLDGSYTVSDHGIEFYTATTTTPPVTEVIYGDNLKDKLRTDVLTISPQTLTSDQKSQARTNIGAASPSQIPSVINNLTSDSTTSALSAAQGKTLSLKLYTINVNGTNRVVKIQTGSTWVNPGAETSIALSFANACVQVVACTAQERYGATINISVYSWSKSGFKCYINGSAGATVSWIAIGY